MGRLIAETLIEEIRNRADIVDIIGAAVTLKKAGANYKGLCPFHGEKSPSFMVSPAKQIFHCFGCGEGGNVFHFLMRKDGLAFNEAVHVVAERYNILIPQTGVAGKKQLGMKEIFTLNERYAQLYHQLLLQKPEGEIGRKYLSGRGVKSEAAVEFQLGYVPVNEAADYRRQITANISQEIVSEAGLYNFYRNNVTNRYSGRLLFPIHDFRGRIIGFGGRSLAAEQQPKYLNSPETAAYHKSNTLFNIHRAKEAVAESGYFIVVEGYLDLITTYTAGFKAVVAPLGTALTGNQVNLLKRFASEIRLVFDGDEAGLKAAFRGVEVILEGGLNCKIVVLPAGEDPDSFIRKNGSAAFAGELEQAKDVVDFWRFYGSKKYDLTKADGRIKAIEEIIPVVAKQPNTLQKDEYLRRLSDAFKLDETALRAEYQKRVSGRFKPESKPVDNITTTGTYEQFPEERDLIQLLLLFPREIRPLFKEHNIAEIFGEPAWRELAHYLLELPEADLLNPAELLGKTTAKNLREKIAALILVDDKEAKWTEPQQAFTQIMQEKKKRHNLIKIKELHLQLKSLTEEVQVKNLLQEITRLKKENLALSGKGGQ